MKTKDQEFMSGYDLPTIYTPEQVAVHFGWSPRKLREFARSIGACRVLGNRMVLLQSDVDAVIEASRPPPTAARIATRLVSTATRSTSGDFAELLVLREKQNREAKEAREAKKGAARTANDGKLR